MDDLNFRDANESDRFGVRLDDYADIIEPYKAIEAERLRRGANPFEAMIFTFGELEAAAPTAKTKPARPITYSAFRDDTRDEDPDVAAAIWAEFDRVNDMDWFRESGRRFRVCTAFPQEIEAQKLVPLKSGYTAVRLSRWSPDDPIPLHREIEVRNADVEQINIAGDEDLEALFNYEPGAHLFISVGRCGDRYETDFDKRGAHSPLHIAKGEPSRPFKITASEAVDYSEGNALLDYTEENESDLPVTRWHIFREMSEGEIRGLVAPGGTGKSARGTQHAVAIGRGEGSAMGLKVLGRRKAWLINQEDSVDQQRKRVTAICKTFGYRMRGLQGWVHFYDWARLGKFCVAVKDRSGRVVQGPSIAKMVQYILDNDIGAVIIDPLIAIHDGLNENDNADMRALFDILGRVAAACGVSIYVIHHSNKPSGASPGGRSGNANSARGGSDIIGAQRSVRTMYAMDKQEAQDWGVKPEDAHRYVRIDDAKTNHYAMSGRPEWFEKVSVPLANGEDSFALRPIQLGNADRQPRCDALVERLLKCSIGQAVDGKGKPINFSPNPKAKGDSNTARWLASHGAGEFTVEEVRRSLAWLKDSVIRVADYKSGGKSAERYELI